MDKTIKLFIVATLLLVVASCTGTGKESTVQKDTVDESVKITASFIESINQYDEVSSFSEGLAVVKKDGKSGYINTKGEEVIPCRYDLTNGFSEGLAEVYKAYDNISGAWGFINGSNSLQI